MTIAVPTLIVIVTETTTVTVVLLLTVKVVKCDHCKTDRQMMELMEQQQIEQPGRRLKNEERSN
jgi:hypothetical protein